MSVQYTHPVTVGPADLDRLDHVNNEVYLRWLLEAASAHAESVGYGMERFLALGAAFVVRRHELEYLAPAYSEERLAVETWTESFERSSAWRCYRIVRDGKAILTGRTLWVFVNLKNGRPMEIPDEIRRAFDSPTASAR